MRKTMMVFVSTIVAMLCASVASATVMTYDDFKHSPTSNIETITPYGLGTWDWQDMGSHSPRIGSNSLYVDAGAYTGADLFFTGGLLSTPRATGTYYAEVEFFNLGASEYVGLALDDSGVQVCGLACVSGELTDKESETSLGVACGTGIKNKIVGVFDGNNNKCSYKVDGTVYDNGTSGFSTVGSSVNALYLMSESGSGFRMYGVALCSGLDYTCTVPIPDNLIDYDTFNRADVSSGGDVGTSEKLHLTYVSYDTNAGITNGFLEPNGGNSEIVFPDIGTPAIRAGNFTQDTMTLYVKVLPMPVGCAGVGRCGYISFYDDNYAAYLSGLYTISKYFPTINTSQRRYAFGNFDTTNGWNQTNFVSSNNNVPTTQEHEFWIVYDKNTELGTVRDENGVITSMSGGNPFQMTFGGTDANKRLDFTGFNVDCWALCDGTNYSCKTPTNCTQPQPPTCTPDWTCSAKTSCLINNKKYCTQVSDNNVCGQSYTGNMSEFTESCTYCYPNWGMTWARSKCVNSFYTSRLIYVDSSNCQSKLGLPSDNGTLYYGRCQIKKKGVIKFKNVNSIIGLDAVNISMVLGTNYSGNLSVTELQDLPTRVLDVGIGSSLKKIIDVNFDPIIMQLTEAELRIYYTNEEIKGLDESKLKLYFYNETTHAWQLVPGSGVNKIENYVYGTITHFSYFGIGGTELNPTMYVPADLPNIATDTLGSAGVNFKLWVPLLVLAFALSVLGMVMVKIRSKV